MAMLLGMSAGAAFAEDLFGGEWYYGTNYATGNASSSYYHGSQWHWTSIGTSSGKYERSNAYAALHRLNLAVARSRFFRDI